MNVLYTTLIKYFVSVLFVILMKSNIGIAQDIETARNSFVFYKIDNQVQIIVNDSLVYDSGVIEGPLDSKIEVDMNDFIENGSNTVTVKLFNAECEECRSNLWVIEYEVYDNGEYIDFVSERGFDKIEIMEVFTQSYDWIKE